MARSGLKGGKWYGLALAGPILLFWWPVSFKSPSLWLVNYWSWLELCPVLSFIMFLSNVSLIISQNECHNKAEKKNGSTSTEYQLCSDIINTMATVSLIRHFFHLPCGACLVRVKILSSTPDLDPSPDTDHTIPAGRLSPVVTSVMGNRTLALRV